MNFLRFKLVFAVILLASLGVQSQAKADLITVQFTGYVSKISSFLNFESDILFHIGDTVTGKWVYNPDTTVISLDSPFYINPTESFEFIIDESIDFKSQGISAIGTTYGPSNTGYLNEYLQVWDNDDKATDGPIIGTEFISSYANSSNWIPRRARMNFEGSLSSNLNVTSFYLEYGGHLENTLYQPGLTIELNTPDPIPEPNTTLLFGAGLAALAAFKRRRILS